MKKAIIVLILTILSNNCSKIYNSKNLIDIKSKRISFVNCNNTKKAKCPRCKGGKKLYEITLEGRKFIDCERCEGKGYSKCKSCEEEVIEIIAIEEKKKSG